jgi:hypothetical protein
LERARIAQDYVGREDITDKGLLHGLVIVFYTPHFPPPSLSRTPFPDLKLRITTFFWDIYAVAIARHVKGIGRREGYL